ncbi:MAG: NAD(P)-dependent alcohol dehydrogenase [Nitrososphaeria archaeon]|nr:NAD(P)-dependent alcohol dehydrogenase [Nitrososphaeria archaeon]
MKGAFLYGPKDIRIEEVEKPSIRSGEVLVKVKAAGICGTDIHYYLEGKTAVFVPKHPFILGHEFSGVIEESNVESFMPGDRVVIEPQIPCFKCYYCRRGKYNLCTNLKFIGTAATFPHINGGFAEYCKVPAETLHRIPEGVMFEEAALAEPLSVAIHACRRVSISPGARALILGAGPIGLFTLIVSRLNGVVEPLIVDNVERRLNWAKEFGGYPINFSEQDVFREVEKATGGDGVDVVFEASGSPAAVATALKCVRKGGCIVLIGNLPNEEIPSRLLNIVIKELDVKGIMRYANTFDAALRLIYKKLFPANEIITHTFSLDEIHEAFEVAVKGLALKAIIKP